jgi:GNAT superfamily N-acetyltransferase
VSNRRRSSKAKPRIAIERSNANAVSRALWQGLIKFNVDQVGPANYVRTVMSVRGANGQLLGGLILESYWRESYVELLWLSARARRAGLGSRLLKEAEHLARRRASRMIHLNTFSFQAPGFYERHGYRRFARLSGSPAGESRHYYVKRLRASNALRRE